MSIEAQLSVTDGMPQSFFELGLAYSLGKAGRIDLVEAHKWFNIAAAQGDRTAARRREELAEEMTREEIAAAQRAAREWMKTARH